MSKNKKSIKEKAEEHLRENNITQYEYKSYIEGADFGANYVLEEIENFQKLFSTCMNAQANGYLTSIIERLKEK